MKNIMNKILSHCSASISWLISMLFYIVMVAIVFAPALMIDLPGIWSYLLLAAAILIMLFLPLLWPIVQFVLWIASIPFALHTPLCGYLIYYLVCAAIYVIFDLIPFILRLICGSDPKNRYR